MIFENILRIKYDKRSCSYYILNRPGIIWIIFTFPHQKALPTILNRTVQSNPYYTEALDTKSTKRCFGFVRSNTSHRSSQARQPSKYLFFINLLKDIKGFKRKQKNKKAKRPLAPERDQLVGKKKTPMHCSKCQTCL